MNLFFSKLYFLFYILWTVSSDMSAQLTPLREKIFDSSKQNKLQWTYSPTNAWNEKQMQLGKDHKHSVYQACNPQFKTSPKTLWTRWIPRQDARELLLDLSFAQVDHNPLEIYVRQSNQPHDQYSKKPKANPVVAVSVHHPFSEDSVPQDEDLSHPKSLNLGRISQSGIYLGFSYSGSCIFIASIQVFFRKCPAFVWKHMEFEETVAGEMKRGVCVNGAVEISTPMMECLSNGTWGPPRGSCVRDAGYQTDGNSCKGNCSFTTLPAPFALVHSVTDSRQRHSSSSPVLSAVIVAVVLALLFLTAGLFIFVRRRKLSGDQDEELIVSFGVTQYRRPTEEEHRDEPERINMSDPEMMDVMKDRLRGLKDVLVERTKLRMTRKLGKGEFGLVYEGIFTPQKGQDIRVAVKTAKDAIHSKEDLESFLKEAEIMMHFNHVNVVKLLGVALEQDPETSITVPLVILPYMKHRDLHSFLRATRYGDIPMFVPHQSLLRFMIDIAAGMEYLSLQGFIHRDLAARNCMLGDDLRVCVADFGLSKRMYSSNYYRHTNGDAKLPVRWMAIESVCDLIFTTKSDVWSFGITMWEITSRGKIPYPGLSNHEILDFLEKGHRPSQGDIDSKLYEVMLGCWHTDPSQRPGFGELGRSLKALLSELPELEDSEESHYINLGLQAASHGQDSEESLEPGETARNIYIPKPDAYVLLKREEKEKDDRETLCSHRL